MIVVRVELWPRGDKSKAREIGTATIANVGGDLGTGSYEVKLFKSPEYATKPGIWKRGEVSGFPRQRLGPWDLLLRALAACVGDRNTVAARDVHLPAEDGAPDLFKVAGE